MTLFRSGLLAGAFLLGAGLWLCGGTPAEAACLNYAPGTNPFNLTPGVPCNDTINVKDFGAKGDGITDDSGSFASAIAAAAGKTVHVTPGVYLWSGTTSVALSNAGLRCDGGPSIQYLSPYTSGCTIKITNSTTPAIAVGQGWAIQGFTFFWPNQTGASATPTVYPALMAGNNIVNGMFADNTVVNAYDTLEVDDGSAGLGRVTWHNNRQYSIRYDFNFKHGAPDWLSVDGTNVFSVAPYDDIARTGNKYLAKWTAANGELVHIDVAASTYANVDGLAFGNALVNGKRYGVRLVSGLLDVSSLNGVLWDSVQTVFSVEGAASTSAVSFTGGYAYATSGYDTTGAPNVFNIASTGAQSFTVTGMDVPFALGSIYYDSQAGPRSIGFHGGNWSSFGQTTTTGSTYYAAATTGNTASITTIEGITIKCAAGTGNAATGVQTTNNQFTTIASNTFQGCSYPVVLTGAQGKAVITGNISTGTVGANSINNLMTGTGVYKDTGNLWDKAPVQAAAP